MFKKLLLFSIILGIYFVANSAFATVGGPTYISEIAFSAVNNSIYYKVHDGGGRGCPPIIHRIDLVTLKDSEVKSCNQVEREFPYSETNTQKYNQFIADTYESLSYLGSVSLKKNNIDVQVEFLSENKLEGEDNWIISRNFRATITQDDKEIGAINFKGCDKDQPHVFEGYMIPNSDKMAMLISNKGDCFEGGYLGESLHIVKGVKYYDKNIVRGFKQASATEPNMGNVVVYAGVANNPEREAPAPGEATTPNKNSNYILYIIVIALGLGLGYFFGRKR
ncbi:MAG: hypothetical protein WC735_04280 [Candidatus Paceibacterota bacterium]|jgi:hypothetical protein